MGSEMNNFVHRIRREREKSIVPMILSDALHARANRVVLEYNSIVRRNACCAPSVILNKILAKKKSTKLTSYLSASSRIMILCRPLGKETFD